jgi:hypothetical protein
LRGLGFGHFLAQLCEPALAELALRFREQEFDYLAPIPPAVRFSFFRPAVRA